MFVPIQVPRDVYSEVLCVADNVKGVAGQYVWKVNGRGLSFCSHEVPGTYLDETPSAIHFPSVQICQRPASCVEQLSHFL